MTRADRLAALLPDRGIDVLLVSGLSNLRWLTGFTGDNGLALVGRDLRLFVTDFRYVEQAAAQVPGFRREQATLELLGAIPGALGGERARLGFDDRDLTVARHRTLSELVAGRAELVPAGGLVEDLRAVKDAAELATIAAAAALADEAFLEVLARGLVGRSEREVALALGDAIRHRGAELSFPPIVATGPHAALPHAEPRGVAIGPGELLIVDWGARVDGYCSDCTRTLATGELDGEARAVYELVLRAQVAALEAVRPGPAGSDVDAVARDIIAAAGHGQAFGHGLGHGVGIDVHEAPRLSRAGNGHLQTGNVVTVEPGVYLPGRLGVRIEDLVSVTDAGPHVLSSVPKQLTVVD